MTAAGFEWRMLRNDRVDPLPTLAELLQALPRGADFVWRLTGVWCLGENAETIHRWSDGANDVPAVQLSKAAGPITQVIDGRFEGTAAAPACRVSIRVADGEMWLVGSDDPRTIAALDAKYPGAQAVDPE